MAALSGADLRGADLRGANLAGADLRGADLSRADLSRTAPVKIGVALGDAEMRRMGLHGEDPRAADLRGGYLNNANLHYADLYGVDLRGVDLTDALNLTKDQADSAVTERFQHCLSRVRTALAIDVIRFGLHRDLLKIRQDLRRAMPRSTGAREVAQCPVDRPFCRGQVPAGWASASGGDPWAGTRVGAVGQDGDALALADPDDAWWVRAAVRSWHRPGRAGEAQGIWPARSVTTWPFPPWRRCLWE